MPFLTPLKVQLLKDDSTFPWITLEELQYEDPISGEVYTVPKHFRTDGASLPKSLVLIPIIGPLLFHRFFGEGVWQGFREGVLHDYLRRPVKGKRPVEAKEAHLIFRRALEEAGYPYDLVNAYYGAVVKFNSNDN